MEHDEVSPAVYILTNDDNTVFFIGATKNLQKQMIKHMESSGSSSFTQRFKAKKLVYYKHYPNMSTAIEREKEIKAWIRKKKIDLIESVNPEWKDLYETL